MVWALEQLEVPAGSTQQTTQATDANAPVSQRYWISSASSPITIGRPLKKVNNDGLLKSWQHELHSYQELPDCSAFAHVQTQGGASCDIVVGDDTSVSKVHVKLELRPAGAGSTESLGLFVTGMECFYRHLMPLAHLMWAHLCFQCCLCG
jgi:hypothetical protein